MEVGVTGTRFGMNENQRFSVQKWLAVNEPTRLHHGMCVGVDVQMNEIARGRGILTRGYPPINMKHIGDCIVDEMELPEEYLVRNHNIVDAVDLLLVIPATNRELLRSGTWATYRYAKKQLVNLIRFNPDGSSYERHSSI